MTASVLARGHADDLFEATGQVALICEAAIEGNIDERTTGLEKFQGALDSHLQLVAVRRQADVASV